MIGLLTCFIVALTIYWIADKIWTALHAAAFEQGYIAGMFDERRRREGRL